MNNIKATLESLSIASLLPFDLKIKQGNNEYRKGAKCPFNIKVDCLDVNGLCRVHGQIENITGFVGLNLCLWVTINGKEFDIKSSKVIFCKDLIIDWKNGVAYKNLTANPQIFLLMIKKENEFRNRDYVVSATLYYNEILIAISQKPLFIRFRQSNLKRKKEINNIKQEDQKKPEKRSFDSVINDSVETIKNIKLPKIEPQKKINLINETEAFNQKGRVKDWDVNNVIQWFQNMFENEKLSSDYSELLKYHNIQGEILESLSTEDWKQIGITKIGDLKILEKNIKEICK